MRTARTLADALSAAPATATLLARVAASERVAALLAALPQVPGFDPSIPGRCELRGKSLVLRVTSPAIAAKLRQSLPSLLGGLQRQGVEVIEIKVQVQPERTGYLSGNAAADGVGGGPDRSGAAAQLQRSLSPAREFARKLALTLQDSPVRAAACALASKLDDLARMRQQRVDE